MDEQAVPSKRRRGIYLLPNLFTTGTLFGGFYAIIAGMNGEYSLAAIAVFIAMICDSLDGLIARKTNTASEFGKEYDSLCDMVAFGLAPSLVTYSWSLHYLAEYRWLGGKLGWVAAFMYAACAALRLARFNVLASRGGAKGNFFGLPSPAAAAAVIGFVWAADDLGWNGADLLLPATILTICAAALMVTNFRFFSLKSLKLTERVPFRYIVFAVLILVLFALKPPEIFFLVFISYAMTGPINALRQRMLKPGGAKA
ncbi:MAG: CDP-diacylglycerol--serine O-phosphatidyltransferase [Stenotrophobium sp.]